MVAYSVKNASKESTIQQFSLMQLLTTAMNEDYILLNFEHLSSAHRTISEWLSLREAQVGQALQQRGLIPNYQLPYYSTYQPENLNDIQMLSAEVLRSSLQPLGMNTSLNIQRNENPSNIPSHTSPFLQNDQERIPIDRPLFVNTSMTAQHRIELYQRLGEPPQDSEPALQFRLP